MLLRQKIKIDVSPQDAQTPEWMQGKCRGVYNWWVMKLCSPARATHGADLLCGVRPVSLQLAMLKTFEDMEESR